MQSTTPSIDQARAAFAESFKAYAQAGNLMRDLLLARGDADADAELAEAVAAQQTVLNQAKQQYDKARRVYVEVILQMMNVRRGTLPPGDTRESEGVTLSVRRPEVH
jgi:hypothetical protein